MSKHIGVLTSGGDSPGLNAAIRGVGKTAIGHYDMQMVGFCDGFRGLVENRTMPLNSTSLSGILTIGGTILGTSRDKPHKMPMGGKVLDMTDAIIANYNERHLDALVCIGGGGTQKNAFRLMQKGLNVITLPKTIDNDVAMTDVSFSFDTALGVATEAIDRLHSTAHSHHRIIVVELMGHNTGWLALGAGVAGGADVILIPEIPYDIEIVAQAIRERSSKGRRFSIVAVAEGALSKEEFALHMKEKEQKKKDKKKKKQNESTEQEGLNKTMILASELQKTTGLEARVAIVGHLQRGGSPSAADRLLATRLGSTCAELIEREHFGIMVAARGDGSEPVPLEEVAGKRKVVPLDHPWIKTAVRVGTNLGMDFK